MENDLKADGLISFLINCDKHNEEVAQFSTLFNYILKQKMFKLLRKDKVLRHRFKTDYTEPVKNDTQEGKRIIRLKKLVFRTIREMPDQDASQLLQERYYDNLPVKELAKKYNCQNKQIYYRLRKALGQLKQLCYKIDLDENLW